MTAKAKIKVIKKGEQLKVQRITTVEKKSPQEAAREIVSTVSDWVSDFQQRRREETKQAFEQLFSRGRKSAKQQTELSKSYLGGNRIFHQPGVELFLKARKKFFLAFNFQIGSKQKG
jgi:uncharacterized protein YutE (UPF0331/DUF86 family)